MTKALATVDTNVLAKLGITEDQAQELLDNGISIEEYAHMVGADLAAERANVAPQAVRWKIVHTGTAFKNEATGELKQKLIGVVPFFHKQRALFLTDGQERPDCSSNNGTIGHYEEDGQQNTRGCDGCPFNEYGSDPKGGRGKACKEMRRLFIVEDGHMVPSTLNIPPTSLKVWDDFINGLQYNNQSASSVVIELSLESKKEGSQEWSVLKTPTIIQKLSPLQHMQMSKMREELEAFALRTVVTKDDIGGTPVTIGSGADSDTDEI